MKRRLSLSLKLTLIVVLVSALIILTLTYINIRGQSSFFESNYSEKGVALKQVLDATLTFYGGLHNASVTQGYLMNISHNNPELLKININMPVGGEMMVFASSDLSEIGTMTGEYHEMSYEDDSIVYIPYHNETTHLITVIAPVNVSGEVVGTYELVFSMDRAYSVFDVQMRTLIALSVVSLFLLVFSFLFLIRRAIVTPLLKIRDAARVIGEGNLDNTIAITTKDELGDLAAAFNNMAQDLKSSREKIEEYNKMLENLLDQKDEFISQLGHDLKNPLTPLVGLIPVIQEQEKDPQIKEHLRIIMNNVEYMRDLVLKTLQLARLRSPATKFDFQPLNLSEQLVGILETQQLFLSENNMVVENKVDPSINVEADHLRLVELFNNLITNATKYTAKGGGTITINAIQEDGFVKVSLKDTGIGMNEEQLSRIFDEFYKADLSRHEMDSSGLGLSIAKRIVERHGGKIWADSEGLGKGSTFYFTLKVSQKIIKKDMDMVQEGVW